MQEQTTFEVATTDAYKTKPWRRALSVALSAALVFSMSPYSSVPVWAGEEEVVPIEETVEAPTEISATGTEEQVPQAAESLAAQVLFSPGVWDHGLKTHDFLHENLKANKKLDEWAWNTPSTDAYVYDGWEIVGWSTTPDGKDIEDNPETKDINEFHAAVTIPNDSTLKGWVYTVEEIDEETDEVNEVETDLSSWVCDNTLMLYAQWQELPEEVVETEDTVEASDGTAEGTPSSSPDDNPLFPTDVALIDKNAETDGMTPADVPASFDETIEGTDSNDENATVMDPVEESVTDTVENTETETDVITDSNSVVIDVVEDADPTNPVEDTENFATYTPVEVTFVDGDSTWSNVVIPDENGNYTYVVPGVDTVYDGWCFAGWIDGNGTYVPTGADLYNWAFIDDDGASYVLDPSELTLYAQWVEQEVLDGEIEALHTYSLTDTVEYTLNATTVAQTESLSASVMDLDTSKDVRSNGSAAIEDISTEWIGEDDANHVVKNAFTNTTIEPSNMRLRFSVNGTVTYQPGDIQIEIPTYFLETRDGRDTGTFVMSVNVSSEDKVSFTTSFAYKQVGDRYIITNTRQFNASFESEFNFSLKNVIAHNIRSGAVSKPFGAIVTVNTPSGELRAASNGIDYTVNTDGQLVKPALKAQSTSETPFTEIKNNLPEDMNSEDYFFVRWYGSVFASGTQDVGVSATFAAGGVDGARIIAATTASKQGDVSIDGNKVTVTNYDTIDATGSVAGGYITVYAAYPKANFKTYISDDQQTVLYDATTLTGNIRYDGVAIDTAKPSNQSISASYVYPKQADPNPNPPEPVTPPAKPEPEPVIPNNITWRSYITIPYSGSIQINEPNLEKLAMGEKVSFKWLGTSSAMATFVGTKLATVASTNEDYATAEKKSFMSAISAPNTMSFNQSSLKIADLISGEDFTYTGVSIERGTLETYERRDITLENGQPYSYYNYYKTEDLAWPAIDIYGTLNGEYQLIGTLNGDGSVTSEWGMTVDSSSANKVFELTFPEGVTDFDVTVTTEIPRYALSVKPKYDLHPTGKVQEILYTRTKDRTNTNISMVLPLSYELYDMRGELPKEELVTSASYNHTAATVTAKGQTTGGTDSKYLYDTNGIEDPDKNYDFNLSFSTKLTLPSEHSQEFIDYVSQKGDTFTTYTYTVEPTLPYLTSSVLSPTTTRLTGSDYEVVGVDIEVKSEIGVNSKIGVYGKSGNESILLDTITYDGVTAVHELSNGATIDSSVNKENTAVRLPVPNKIDYCYVVAECDSSWLNIDVNCAYEMNKGGNFVDTIKAFNDLQPTKQISLNQGYKVSLVRNVDNYYVVSPNSTAATYSSYMSYYREAVSLTAQLSALSAGQYDDAFEVYGSASLKYDVQPNDWAYFEKAVNSGYTDHETGGIFYLLMPQGYSVDKSDIVANNSSTEIKSVQMVPNWRDSGRTLVKVRVGYTQTTVSGGPSVRWDGAYSYSSYQHYGKILRVLAVYESDRSFIGNTFGSQGEPDTPRGNMNTTSSAIRDAEVYLVENLSERDDCSFVYAADSEIVDALLNNNYDFGVQVADLHDMSFVSGRSGDKQVSVYGGGIYIYQLQFSSDSSHEMKNVLLVDKLESYGFGRESDDPQDATAKTWNGSLVYVDTSELISLGAKPVIYYASSDFDPTNVDLGDTSIWSQTKPDHVVGVAVDCSQGEDGEFVLGSQETALVRIGMRAPIDDIETLSDAYAFNDAYASADQVNLRTGDIQPVALQNGYTRVSVKPLSITATKEFEDDNNRDGIRPDEVEITLMLDGEPFGDSVILNEENSWTYTWQNVPAASVNGADNEITFKEESVEGYTFSYSADKSYNYMLKNTHIPEKIIIDGDIIWKDELDKTQRPASVNLQLYADDKQVASKLVNKNALLGDQEFLFGSYYKYRDGGIEVQYKVTENYIPKYKTEYSSELWQKGFTITNSYYPYGDVLITKEIVNKTEANKDKVFEVMLNVTEDGEGVFGEWVLVRNGVEDGVISNGGKFIIHDGDEVRIKDVPSESYITINETNLLGFVPQVNYGNNGKVLAGQTTNIELVNTYNATGIYNISANKELVGSELTNRQFSFELRDENNRILRTATNDKEGNIVFGALNFDTDDIGKTYTYTVNEVIYSNQTWYKFDESIKTISIMVVDKGDGTLGFGATYGETGDTFVNEYDAKGSAVINGEVQLLGRDLKAEEFSFELLKGEEVIGLIKNDDHGFFTFEPLVFGVEDLDGENVYTIRQVLGTDESVEYDLHTEHVKCVVSLASTGMLLVKLENTGGELKWVNKVKGDDLVIEKRVTEGSPTDVTFDYQVTLELPAGYDDFDVNSLTYEYETLDGATIDLEKWVADGRPEIVANSGEYVGKNVVAGTKVKVPAIDVDVEARSVEEQVVENEPENGIDGVLKGVLSAVFGVEKAYADTTASGTWGTCAWDIVDGVLTIREGTGANIFSNSSSYIPWYAYRSFITEVVISENVVAPKYVDYMFCGMTNLTKADLSGLDTSTTVTMITVFTNCTNLTEIKIGPKTFAKNIFTGLTKNGFISKDGAYGPYTVVDCATAITEENTGWYEVIDLPNGSWGTCQWNIWDGILTIHQGTGANITSNNSTYVPWYSYRSQIKEVVISENVVAPAYISYMFYGMTNLTKADLSGLDTSSTTTMTSVFTNCTNLAEVKIGPKTFAKNIFTGLTKNGFISKDGAHGPYTVADCATAITEENTGWYEVIDLPNGSWGTCQWNIWDSILTIHQGTGANITSNNSTYVPWYSYRSQIKEVVISENVVAPAYISYMFYGMTNLTKADLSGLDTSSTTTMTSVFTNCTNLAEVKIGPKTFAKDIFTGQTNKGFMSQDGQYGPNSSAECATVVTEGNAGWYDVVQLNVWGTCRWDVVDGVLTIHEGTGASVALNDSTYVPWYNYRSEITEVVISENVVAPSNVSYMFYGMTNLTKADLSGLDTSSTTTMTLVFTNCTNLAEIKIGPKTFAKNIFTGLTKNGFISKDGAYGPYTVADCATVITEENAGWYEVIPVGLWGTCRWDIIDSVLTIHQGTGANITSNTASYVPWYNYRSEITEVVISENVVAPAYISYMFYGMTNLTKADLSGLDTSSTTIMTSVFANCTNLAEIKIGPKTFAKNVFTGQTNKGFMSKDGACGPYTVADCATVITEENAGWYEVVDLPNGSWGTCRWNIIDSVLTIHQGTGANITSNTASYVPWYNYRSEITEVVISENVVAPAYISYMFYNMTNLTKADLSGLDTSSTTQMTSVFYGCNNFSEIKIGTETFAENIFTGLFNKGFMSQDGQYGPYSPTECATVVTEENAGWYDVVDIWGTCVWEVVDGVLTIHQGTGANIFSNSSTYVPWYTYRSSITEVVISENVVAPSNVSYMFYGMTNLTKADLSRLDTSSTTTMISVFTNCTNLAEVKIGPKTFAKDIFTDFTKNGFMSKDGAYGPYTVADCATVITEENAGWYDVMSVGLWGACRWDIIDSVLTIHEGTGANIIYNTASYVPWYNYLSEITEVVISENVVAPAYISYMFYDMTNLTKADLSGLDTSSTTTMTTVFTNCTNLTEVKIGPKTFAKNIFTGQTNKGFMSQDGQYGPYSSGNCATVITEENAGWYDVVTVNLWGSCIWDFTDGILTIHQGAGENIVSNSLSSIPWYNYRSTINEVVFSGNVIAPIDISYMFSNCAVLESIDFSGFNTSNVVNMNSMFSECSKLREVNIDVLDYSKVETLDGFFYGCDSLKYLDLRRFYFIPSGAILDLSECCNLGHINVSNGSLDSVKTSSSTQWVSTNYRYGPWTFDELKNNLSVFSEGEYITTEAFTVNFDGNGGVGYQSSVSDYRVIAPSSSFTKKGCTCVSWNTCADGTGRTYKFGDLIIADPGEELTLYAQWSDVTIAGNGHLVINVRIPANCRVLIGELPGNSIYDVLETYEKESHGLIFTMVSFVNSVFGIEKAYADSTSEGTWGTCEWDVTGDVLTIKAGTGNSTSLNSSSYVPWYNYRSLIKEVVISEKVIAPSNINYMFYGMTNLVKADLSGLDTSNVTICANTFASCNALKQVNVGLKTFAKDIFCGSILVSGISYQISRNKFVSQSSTYGPYSSGECSTEINYSNTGWYNLVFANSWGTCDWYIHNGVLKIWAGTGRDIISNTLNSSYGVPWYSYRSTIKEVVIKEEVIAPAYISYMFYGMTNLIKADLSGLDTSKVSKMDQVFFNCDRLTEIKIGQKTFSKDIFTGFANEKKFASKDGSYGPFTSSECSSVITDENIGWYDIVGLWGTCDWNINDGKLVIFSGKGANTTPRSLSSLPWMNYNNTIKSIEIIENVECPAVLDGFLSNMPKLSSVDLSGLDTTDVESNENVFFNSLEIAVVKLSQKTLEKNIFTGFDSSIAFRREGQVVSIYAPSALTIDDLVADTETFTLVPAALYTFYSNDDRQLVSQQFAVTLDGRYTGDIPLFDGYNYAKFLSWNTAADATGETYSDERILNPTVAGPIDLYAVWAQPYAMIFENNDPTITTYQDGIVCYPDELVTIPALTIIVPDGYRFLGWNTAADGSGDMYQPGQQYIQSTTDKVRFFAQWKKSFNPNAPIDWSAAEFGVAPGWVLDSATDTTGVVTYKQPGYAKFVNRWAPGETSVMFSAEVYLDGYVSDEHFQIQLLDADNNVLATNDVIGGRVSFDPITITDAGNQTYYFEQVNMGEDWINYDDHMTKIMVEATMDADGNLSARVGYQNDRVFNNVSIPGMFTFVQDVQTGDEATPFAYDIKVTSKSGDDITEKYVTDTSFTGDTSMTIANLPAYSTVTVRTLEDRAGWTNTIDANSVVVKPNETSVITSVWNYAATGSIEVVIPVHKTLVGGSVSEGQFTFSATDAAHGIHETSAVDADGNAGFALTLSAPGTYTFTIAEVAGADSTYVYDTTTHEVSVTVVDDGQGNFTTESGDVVFSAPVIEFVNAYNTGNVVFTHTHTKGATGAALAKMFDYMLVVKDATGVEYTADMTLVSGEGDAESSRTVHSGDMITLSATDGFSLDKVPVGATVALYAPATPGFSSDGECVLAGVVRAGETLSLHDDLEYASQSMVPVDSTVVLIGAPIENYSFKFDLFNERGQRVGYGSSDGGNNVTLGGVEFTSADDGKTFAYVARQTSMIDPNIDYDTRDLNFEVTVHDTGAGEMELEYSWPDGSQFVNIYVAPDVWQRESEKVCNKFTVMK